MALVDQSGDAAEVKQIHIIQIGLKNTQVRETNYRHTNQVRHTALTMNGIDKWLLSCTSDNQLLVVEPSSRVRNRQCGVEGARSGLTVTKDDAIGVGVAMTTVGHVAEILRDEESLELRETLKTVA